MTLISISNRASAKSLSSQECVDATLDCLCFSPVDADKLAAGLEKLEICEVALREKISFVENNLNIDTPQDLWWQKPEFIVSGIAVSASVGFILGVMSKK